MPSVLPVPHGAVSAPRSAQRLASSNQHAHMRCVAARAGPMHDQPPPRDDGAGAAVRRRLALLSLFARPGAATAATKLTNYKPPPTGWSYEQPTQWPATWPACGVAGSATPFPLAPPFTPAPRRRLVPAYRPASFIALDAGTTVHFVAPTIEGENPAGGAAGGVITIDDDGREHRFTLTQFHFHRPAEELLPNREQRALLGVHLVHVADEPGDGNAARVLVVAASIEQGETPHRHSRLH